VLATEKLRSLLTYDPETGEFRWRDDVKHSRKGKVAGRINKHGYLQISIDGRRYQGHRLAHLYMTGEMPPVDVDHRGSNRADNRWSELRPATNRQNCHNRRPTKGRPKGVTLHRKSGRWQAQIKIAGKSKYLGLFDTPEAAHVAYAAAATAAFGEFARIA
jgi:hypothetical protein